MIKKEWFSQRPEFETKRISIKNPDALSRQRKERRLSPTRSFRKGKDTETLKKIAAIRKSLGIDQKSDKDTLSRQLKVQIRELANQVYFARKGTLDDDLLLVSAGLSPDTQEPFFELVDGAIGQHYDAHGIAKTDQLTKLLALLDHGIDPSRPFHTAPFEVPQALRAALGAAFGTSGGTAHKDGIAVVTGGYKERLDKRGITHVFINDVYSSIKAPLQELYPQYDIHLLSEQKDVLEGEAKKSKK